MAWQDRAYNRDNGIPPIRFAAPPITRLSLVLIVVCFAIYIAQVLLQRSTNDWLTAWGSLTLHGGLAFKQPWRWITYQYLHGGVFHVGFNCLAIYFFVPPLERRWGWKKTFAFYTAGGVIAGICFALMTPIVSPRAYLIGASGSILACLGACALLLPEMSLILVLFSVPIRPAAAIIGFLYFLSVLAEHDLSNAAHLGGLVFGFFGPYLAGPVLFRFHKRFQQKRTLRLALEERREQAEVDRILVKVHDSGMNSLTWRERRTLRKATEHQRQRDLELSRRRGW